MASIKCKYNGTGSESIRIAAGPYWFSYVYVNGQPIEIPSQGYESIYYNISSTDIVEFVLKTNSLGESSYINNDVSDSFGVFRGCDALISVEFIGDIKAIGDGAFSYCHNLTSITIPDSVTEIGSSAFFYCDNLTSITIPDSVTEIGNRAFAYTGISNVIIPSGITKLPVRIFMACDNLTSFTIPDHITEIGSGAFYDCHNLTSVTIPDSVTEIGSWAFKKCWELASIRLPQNITSIEGRTFYNCAKLRTIVIPDSVSVIKESAFQACHNLESICLGSGLTKLEKGVFAECGRLTTIYVKALVAPELEYEETFLANGSFEDSPFCLYIVWAYFTIASGGTLYYPTGSDYSQWLSHNNTYLGYYGWNGVETDPEDMPDLPDSPTDPDDPYSYIDVYVNNGPIVLLHTAGTKEISLEIEGGPYKDGLEVVEFSSLSTGADWLRFDYEESGSDDGKTFYYYFTLDYDANETSKQRYTNCSGICTLANGVQKLFTFNVMQNVNTYNPNISVSVSATESNPMFYEAYDKDVEKRVGVYYGRPKEIYDPEYGGDYLTLRTITSEYNEGDERFEYKYGFKMNRYNVFEQNVNESVVFMYDYYDAYPSTEIKYYDYEQLVVVKGCQYPFGLKQNINNELVDIDEVGDVKTIIVNPSGETIAFETYYPFYMQGSTVEQNAYKRIVLNNNGDSGISINSDDTNILVDGYDALQDKYYVTFNGNETESSRIATLEISYKTKDNITYTDKVIMIQPTNTIDPDVPVDPDTPDGPYVTGTTTILYFNYDGTPKTTNEFDVYWYGDYYDRNIVNDSSHFGVSGEKIETTDDYVKFHYTVNCPRNTTSETIIGSCYFNIKLDADTYGESFIVEFSQDANPEEENTPVVNAFTQSAKVNIDGTPEMTSFTDIACGYAGVEIQEPLIEGDWIHLGTPTTGSGIGYDTVMRYPISFDANDGEPRQGKITFSGLKTDGETLTSVCTISQAGTTVDPDEPDTPDIPDVPVDGEDYIGPIWKDVEFDFGLVDVVEYGVYTTVKERVGNQLIDVDKLLFMGRSYLRPNASTNKIIVNKICQDYMDIPLLEKDVLELSGGYNKFILKSADGTRTYRTFRFINDWSYDDYFNTGILSHPILKENDKVYRNQLLPFTVFGASETVGVTYGIQYGGHKDEYGNVIPDWSNGVNVTNDVITEVFPYSGRTAGAVSYTINGKKYNIVNECVQYVLYYLNPWGGYDWFPIRGKVIEKDRITAYTYQQNYNNQTLEFGKRRYLTEISKHFTLHTQWMSEDESSRMWYLLQSNIVYLHNLVENKIYPVVITNTEQEHKRKLRGTRISYAIEVDLSQTRERI